MVNLRVRRPACLFPPWNHTGKGSVTVGWRRAAGALIMLLGAAILVGVASAGTIHVAASLGAGVGLFSLILDLSSLTAPLLLGLAVMIAGRMTYGLWRQAAPIAHTTAEITFTVGLLAVIGFGGLLVFMMLSGLKPDDTPAVWALMGAALVGALLAHFGVGLRGRRFLD